MNFFKRISFYFFGFLVGLVFLFYIMDKKSATFNYSPNKRVLGDISKKKWILDNGDNFLELNKMILLVIIKLISLKVMLKKTHVKYIILWKKQEITCLK